MTWQVFCDFGAVPVWLPGFQSKIFFFIFDMEKLLVVLLLLTVMKIKFNTVQIICLGLSDNCSFIAS